MENKSIYDQPLVSVALCSYNGAAFIRQQLESILNQTWKKLEVVVIDDASKDDTASIISELAGKDDRIRLQVNAENLGYNRNFEKAISLCKAEYIATSDQDDVWELNKIETIMNNWPDGAQFVYSLSGDFWGDDLTSRRSAPKVFYSDIDDTHKLVFNSPVHGHACMMKKDLVKKCTPFPTAIFYDWWLSMHAASSGKIVCIPLTLTWHRIHEKNFSRNLTSIKDQNERNCRLREQCAFFIESFFATGKGKNGEKESLMKYAELLRQMDGKKFSWKMFWYILNNRKKVFHYKRKPFAFISQLKHAFRMGRKGLL